MGDNKGDEQREVVDFYKSLGTGEMSNITVAKLASHGNDWGTTSELGKSFLAFWANHVFFHFQWRSRSQK